MKKSNKCFEMDPDAWRAINDWGLQLLLLPNLACYRHHLPMEEDLQDEWEAAVMHPGKYVNLLVGQHNDKDLRADSDEENHYDSGPWDRIRKTTSWPTIRSRRTRVGLRRGPMKQKTSEGSR